MKEKDEWEVGALIGRRAPMDIGFPLAVVFRMRNGIGLLFWVKSSISLSSGGSSFVLNRSATKTLGARDLVVMVLKQRIVVTGGAGGGGDTTRESRRRKISG